MRVFPYLSAFSSSELEEEDEEEDEDLDLGFWLLLLLTCTVCLKPSQDIKNPYSTFSRFFPYMVMLYYTFCQITNVAVHKFTKKKIAQGRHT